MSDHQIETEKRLGTVERQLRTVTGLLIFTTSLGAGLVVAEAIEHSDFRSHSLTAAFALGATMLVVSGLLSWIVSAATAGTDQASLGRRHDISIAWHHDASCQLRWSSPALAGFPFCGDVPLRRDKRGVRSIRFEPVRIAQKRFP